jgi:2-polyprenyl-3-methyl-5-hydroxy-6-metoxy-1,4-benzoquinol methylase
MQPWKSTLYERYVSTEQVQPITTSAQRLKASDYPYLQRLIARHVPADREQLIADLGCGHGVLVHCLRAAGYRNVSGVDVSGEQVAIAKGLGIEGVEQGDLQSFLRRHRGTLGVVLLMDVLEHLTKQEIFDMLAAVHAALRPGGRVIIHAPNGAGMHGMRILYGDFTHETCLTPQSAGQILRANGFSDVAVYEDVPTLHSAKGVVRFVLWHLLTLPRRLLLYAETGVARHVLSQNLLVVAQRPVSTQSGALPRLVESSHS